jgi:hypothetical protein
MDLFTYQPPAAVLHLPLAVWGRTIWRSLADAFVDHMLREPDRMDFWWRGVDHQIGQDLRKAGLSDSDVAAELHRARQYVAQRVAQLSYAQARA